MERVVRVTYYGHCPTCGERQSSNHPEEVDVDCVSCEGKKESKRIHDTKYKALEDGIIQGISGYDENGMPSVMTIYTKDFIYCIKFKELLIESIWKR